MADIVITDDYDNIETGDEIHLTSGEVWSCVFSTCGPIDLGVHFVKGSFAEAREHGDFVANSCEKLYAPSVKDLIIDAVKDLIIDAVKGGAKIHKGVGLAKKARKRRKSGTT